MRLPARLLVTAGLAMSAVVGLAGPTSLATSASAASSSRVDAVRLNGFEAALAADLNAARRSAGLRPLVVVAGATDVARRWSWRLAQSQVLSYNPSIVSDITRSGSAAWTEIAENVGEGPSDQPHALFRPYRPTPPHRANILDPSARYLGIGTVERGGLA